MEILVKIFTLFLFLAIVSFPIVWFVAKRRAMQEARKHIRSAREIGLKLEYDVENFRKLVCEIVLAASAVSFYYKQHHSLLSTSMTLTALAHFNDNPDFIVLSHHEFIEVCHIIYQLEDVVGK
jgi:hypothetical protein